MYEDILKEFEKQDTNELEGFAYALYVYDFKNLTSFNKGGARYVKPVSVFIEKNKYSYNTMDKIRVYKRTRKNTKGTQIAVMKNSYECPLKVFLTKEEAIESYEKDLRKYKEEYIKLKEFIEDKIEQFELDMHKILQLH